MSIEETIMDMTSRTPSGGGFWLGNGFFQVRYGVDWWEWKYRGSLFYDLQDLAQEFLARSGVGLRLVGHSLQSLSWNENRLRKALRH
jgi:hypothetical protein